MNPRRCDDLVSAAEHFADQCRDAARSGPGFSETAGVRAAFNCVQSLLFQLEPTAFLQHIAQHSELLACLNWLGEFQLLAYLPLGADDGLPIKDIAELADVSESQLHRIVRLMAMSGFLREPQPGFVAHTALSASFARRPTQLDAAMFLAETAVPCALHMAASTRRQQSFAVDWASKRVERLWPTFLHALGSADDTDVLRQMDWASIVHNSTNGGLSGSVVDVGGPPPHKSKGSKFGSAAVMGNLAQSHPELRFVVQTDSLEISDSIPVTYSNITVHHRAHGASQTIKDAAVYLLRLSTTSVMTVRSRIIAELRAHLGILQANRTALLILTSPILPESGTLPAHIEQLARLRDLSRLQLMGNGNLTLQELVDLVNSIHDGDGGLVVVKKLHAPQSAFIGLGIRYHTTIPLAGADSRLF